MCAAGGSARKILSMHSDGKSAAAQHGYGHDHGHTHGFGVGEAVSGILGAAVVATLVLVAVEFIAAYVGHTIALASDAVHNLTDVPTLVISWLALRWARRPPTPEKTFGYHRAGILAALKRDRARARSDFCDWRTVVRLRVPVAVGTGLMMWVSLLALAINGGITLAVHRGRRDLNVRTVWLHNLGDALSNIAIFAGAIVIRFTGAQWVDPALGIAIGAMVLWSGAGILRESGHILLEGLPRNLRLEDVAAAVLRVEGVQEAHDIHIWTLGPTCSRFLATFASRICTWKRARGFLRTFASRSSAIFTSRTPQFSSSAPGCRPMPACICPPQRAVAANNPVFQPRC